MTRFFKDTWTGMFYKPSHTFLLILAKKGGTIKNIIYQINKGLSERCG